MILPDYITNEIERIASDNVNGAELLTQRSVALFQRVGEDEALTDAEEVKNILRTTARLLVDAQRPMAGLFTVANGFLQATDGVDDIAGLRTNIARTVRTFRTAGEEHLKRIAAHTADLLQPGSTVLTHSNSKTVLTALMEVKKRGTNSAVICSESRPMMEGVALARRLGEAGFRVTLATDAGILGLIAQSQVVLLGADAVATDGIVNKAGTLGIAAVARMNGIPSYALCSSFKMSPSRGATLIQREGDLNEVLPQPPNNVVPANPSFDLTPHELLTATITEDGALSPEAIKAKISSLNIHPAIR